MRPIIKFSNCFILRDHKIIKEDILVRDGKFLDPEPLFFDEHGIVSQIVDCRGLLLSPGLIDLQINGGFGVDFSHDIRNETGAKTCLAKVAKGLLAFGNLKKDSHKLLD
jgi:N-acetylglucosamine-6-phosphate deacetylase